MTDIRNTGMRINGLSGIIKAKGDKSQLTADSSQTDIQRGRPTNRQIQTEAVKLEF